LPPTHLVAGGDDVVVRLELDDLGFHLR
jgi:hypothetical protein